MQLWLFAQPQGLLEREREREREQREGESWFFFQHIHTCTRRNEATAPVMTLLLSAPAAIAHMPRPRGPRCLPTAAHISHTHRSHITHITHITHQAHHVHRAMKTDQAHVGKHAYVHACMCVCVCMCQRALSTTHRLMRLPVMSQTQQHASSPAVSRSDAVSTQLSTLHTQGKAAVSTLAQTRKHTQIHAQTHTHTQPPPLLRKQCTCCTAMRGHRRRQRRAAPPPAPAPRVHHCTIRSAGATAVRSCRR